MSVVVELFRADKAAAAEPRSLPSLVLPFVSALLKETATLDGVWLVLHAIPIFDEVYPPPSGLTELTREVGYATLHVEVDQKVVYHHPHPIRELIAPGLEVWLKELPPDSPPPVAFALRREDTVLLIQGQLKASPPHSSVVRTGAESHASFRLRPLQEAPPPLIRLADLARTPLVEPSNEPVSDAVRVLVAESVHRMLTREQKFSPDVEEGGYLLGRIFRDEGDPARFIVRVNRAVQAEHTGASLVHLTFTGDSLSAVKRWMDVHADGDRLLGWYHTHLFSATDSLGLSSVDLRLHFTTFRIAWQVAGLVNIDPRSPDHRVLRFYVRQGDTMVRCPVEVLA